MTAEDEKIEMCRTAMKAALEAVQVYCGGAVYGLDVAYHIDEGIYSSEEFERITPRTAESVFKVLEIEYKLSPENCEWEYTFTQLESLVASDRFTRTLIKYVDVDPGEVERYIEEKRIPEEDLEDLVANWRRAPKHFLVDKIRKDIERVKRIIAEINKTGAYYPPVVDEYMEIIDGAHRIVAISCLYRPYQRIYYWKMREVI